MNDDDAPAYVHVPPVHLTTSSPEHLFSKDINLVLQFNMSVNRVMAHSPKVNIINYFLEINKCSQM